ncbi:hypothetical protein ABEB36_007196 [Hypothenemus hampei]|uniref:Peptidase S1 domain-containing protein n=1 Tax=Hypothenemus hampei TaxID=57062 RepID=A0ABD1ET46_HYPHA
MKIYTWLIASVSYYATLVCSQEIDIEELSTTLSKIEEITVRTAPGHFKFNRDRTPSLISKRIIGGDVATAHEYPFQVALYIYVQNTLYFCGGTLIDQQWVLTAAHCVESATSIIVVLGSHDLSVQEDSRIAFNTSSYRIHELWDSDLIQYDIALIKLPETVLLKDYIGTVAITDTTTETFSGLTSRCLGWGKTVLGSLSTVLRYVDAPVITNEECASYDDYGNYIVSQHLCTSGTNIVGSCNGDSGGPLLIDGIQVGIVSFGAEDCAAGFPSVYTRLSEFQTWVASTTENSSIEVTEAPRNADNSAVAMTYSLTLISLVSAINKF